MVVNGHDIDRVLRGQILLINNEIQVVIVCPAGFGAQIM